MSKLTRVSQKSAAEILGRAKLRMAAFQEVKIAAPQRAANAIETEWHTWVRAVFPAHVDKPPAPYHAEFAHWLWAVQNGVRPEPFVAIWPRGFGKSTWAELACAYIAARRLRSYALYTCATQEQADDHVQNVAALLEDPRFGEFYAAASQRRLGKYGNPRGWRRNRLRTASGFTLDAIGLDTAARGAKMEDARPGLLILDDLDGEHDTTEITNKKETTITQKLIPAGGDDLAVIALQNLVHADSIFSRLADGTADYLADRIVSGPWPAIRDATYEVQSTGAGTRTTITHGTPTWPAVGIPECEEKIKGMGLSAFKRECQHEVAEVEGGPFANIEFLRCPRDAAPEMVRMVCWIDPAVTNKDQSDSQAIQIDGIASDGRIYRWYSWERHGSPLETVEHAILKAIEYKCECVGIETDQGGETWESVYAQAWSHLMAKGLVDDDLAYCPQFRFEKAGAGFGPKAHRANQQVTDYENGMIVHVLGTHNTLEKALKRFPKRKPFDLTDASFWSWYDLRAPAGWGVLLGGGARSGWEDPEGFTERAAALVL